MSRRHEPSPIHQNESRLVESESSKKHLIDDDDEAIDRCSLDRQRTQDIRNEKNSISVDDEDQNIDIYIEKNLVRK